MGEHESVVESLREKSVVEPEDYAGLQLDTRLSRVNGDQAPQAVPFEELASPTDGETLCSPVDRPLSGEAPMAIIKEFPDKEAIKVHRALEPGQPDPVEEAAEPKTTPRRTCGPWRAKYVLLWSIPVAIAVILAIVLGAVLGSRSTSTTSSPTSSSQPSPTTIVSSVPSATSEAAEAIASDINANLPGNDIMVASPLAPVANHSSGLGGYSLFFQAANGHAKYAFNNGLGEPWNPANAIFTDAMNGTGLASFSYPNNTGNSTLVQTSIFYVTDSLRLYEKRNNGSGYFDVGSLDALPPISMTGNSSIVGEGGWNGFRMTAAYSANFSTGPGARLFVHQGNYTSHWIQELVWMQNNDSWAYGNRFNEPTPESHLAAVIEPQSQTLRLFYSMPDNSIQEKWLNMTSSSPEYQNGIGVPGALLHPAADFAVVSTSNCTLLYYFSTTSPGATLFINELALPILPNLWLAPQNHVIVTEPSLQATDTNGKNTSVFVPLGAVGSPAGDAVSVFFTSDAADPRGGYGTLLSVYRKIGDQWGTDSTSQHMAVIPLGYVD